MKKNALNWYKAKTYIHSIKLTVADIKNELKDYLDNDVVIAESIKIFSDEYVNNGKSK